jgi:carbamoyltransferase
LRCWFSAFRYDDSAAAIIRDGQILAAAQEERFTRKKHDPRFPANAISYCLTAAKADAKSIDCVAWILRLRCRR